ncbi:MAG TPA: TolC family protein [Terriglobales bacterium]
MVRRLLCGSALSAVLVCGAMAQTAGGGLSVQDLSGGQNPLLGSVPQGQVSAEPVKLTILDALDRGLKYNLGIILTQQGTNTAAADRLRALSNLLPQVNGHLADSSQQINLEAYGFPVAPGQPYIFGPFNVTDIRATVASNVINFNALNRYRASQDDLRASRFNLRNTRDLVVLAVGYQYLTALADAARVDAAQAQFTTAEALYKQAVDLHNAGMVPNIDELRAQVEMQAQQQRLLVVQNEYAKQLLAVGRVIGLPSGQAIVLTDKIPAPQPIETPLDLDIKNALDTRFDYKQALSSLDAAEHRVKAAKAERLPTLGFQGDFGTIGSSPVRNHETFSAAAAIQFPIFEGGRITGDIQAAEATAARARAQVDDLRARIEYEVRTAYLDVDAATKQLNVATSNLDLAKQQVAQSRDRFAAGVTNNLEVVQAQEAQAAAEESYISSLFAHNFSKLSLARAIGIAEDATRKFLGGK